MIDKNENDQTQVEEVFDVDFQYVELNKINWIFSNLLNSDESFIYYN